MPHLLGDIVMNDYWGRTDDYLGSHGGVEPPCPRCGQSMFSADDHGRFTCFCSMGTTHDVGTGLSLEAAEIPQVDVSGMSNAEKALIPPIHRLDAPATEAEQNFFRIAARGVDAMDDPEYWKAGDAIDEERDNASKKQ